VEPFDKSVIGDIERAIVEADLGLTPQNDGSLIRLNIPSLTGGYPLISLEVIREA
jgi:ribosome recycling factor